MPQLAKNVSSISLKVNKLLIGYKIHCSVSVWANIGHNIGKINLVCM